MFCSVADAGKWMIFEGKSVDKTVAGKDVLKPCVPLAMDRMLHAVG